MTLRLVNPDAMTVLEWVNSVRGELCLAPLSEMAGAAPDDSSPGRRSSLAQSIPGLRTYRGGGRVISHTRDSDLARALEGVAANPAAGPGGGAAFGYLADRLTESYGFDLWLPGNVEGLYEAAA